MILNTFVKKGWKLHPIEMELCLVPGVPQIKIMGLPDQVIKESTLRIRSALKSQGFRFPKAKQILVHLKPSHLKKTSLGLDLPIIAALLIETDQLKLSSRELNYFFYGEVSLRGQVMTPEDLLDTFFDLDLNAVVTGEIDRNVGLQIVCVNNLKQLMQLPEPIKNSFKFQFESPKMSKELKFTSDQARLLTVIASGEHPTLFAGSAGSGKSTLAKAVHGLLRNPTEKTFFESRMISSLFGRKINWRPFVHPHHTSSHLAMVGGGVMVRPGEISRAHGGVLLLDELLEFNVKVQEALREPFEEGKLTLARNSHIEEYPAKSLILATTNLCPCGKWEPGLHIDCHRGIRKCRSYLERLSGPLLDRFSILTFSAGWTNERLFGLDEIALAVEKTIEFALSSRGQKKLNQDLSVAEIEDKLDPFLLKELVPPRLSSNRRYRSLLQVARTLSDLEGESKIYPRHIEESSRLTIEPFRQLEKAEM